MTTNSWREERLNLNAYFLSNQNLSKKKKKKDINIRMDQDQIAALIETLLDRSIYILLEFLLTNTKI